MQKHSKQKLSAANHSKIRNKPLNKSFLNIPEDIFKYISASGRMNWNTMKVQFFTFVLENYVCSPIVDIPVDGYDTHGHCSDSEDPLSIRHL
jgi:hypothetical protein